MLKKMLTFGFTFILSLLLVVGVSARIPAPREESLSKTQPWNDAYATMTTHASIVDGYYATYQGGSWRKSNPIGYSSTTEGPTATTPSNYIRATGYVTFSFFGTTSRRYTVSNFHYFK